MLVWRFSNDKYVPIDKLRRDELLTAAIHVQKKLHIWNQELNIIIEHIQLIDKQIAQLLKSTNESIGANNLYKQLIFQSNKKIKDRDNVYKKMELYDRFNDAFTAILLTDDIGELMEQLDIEKSKNKLLVKQMI